MDNQKNIRISLSRSQQSNDILESSLISWKISYCLKDGFCYFPVEVYVSLKGNVQLTNPKDLEDRIKRMGKKYNRKLYLLSGTLCHSEPEKTIAEFRDLVET